MEVGQRARESPRLKNPVSTVSVLLGHLPDHTFSDVWRADPYHLWLPFPPCILLSYTQSEEFSILLSIFFN